MARKKKHEDHVNHEAWAIPYGDLVTLLFALFTVMYAMSSVNEGKFRVLSDSMIAAFIATIYGIAFANLLFLPMGNKLKSVIHGQSQVRTMVIEGIIAIAQGENPRNIESKLQGYFHH